jgi:hypothetical protein
MAVKSGQNGFERTQKMVVNFSIQKTYFPAANRFSVFRPSIQWSIQNPRNSPEIRGRERGVSPAWKSYPIAGAFTAAVFTHSFGRRPKI